MSISLQTCCIFWKADIVLRTWFLQKLHMRTSRRKWVIVINITRNWLAWQHMRQAQLTWAQENWNDMWHDERYRREIPVIDTGEWYRWEISMRDTDERYGGEIPMRDTDGRYRWEISRWEKPMRDTDERYRGKMTTRDTDARYRRDISVRDTDERSQWEIPMCKTDGRYRWEIPVEVEEKIAVPRRRWFLSWGKRGHLCSVCEGWAGWDESQ